MRIQKSLCAAALVAAGMLVATSALAGQRVVVIAANIHAASIGTKFLGVPTTAPCLPTNVVVEPCRDWYGARSTEEPDWPTARDEYGLEYQQIGHYRYYH